MEYQQITLDEWLYWKEDIRNKLRETAENFVYIGYRLKQIRDSGMYDGAEDIFEFARKEYGLGKSTVSRFIAINQKFSEGGNSIELKVEYRDIGSSKLAEMLTLPDAECGLITERTTVKEIRELKSFLREFPQEEKKGSALEAAQGDNQEGVESETDNAKLKGEGKAQESWKETLVEGETEVDELAPLNKCLIEYFRDKKELLHKIIPLIYENRFDRAAEQINPLGYATYKKGLVFLFLYEFSQGVKYKVFGQPEVCALSWKTFLLRIYDIYGDLYEAGEENIHGIYYGEPEKESSKSPGEPERDLKENIGETGIILDSEYSVATSQQNRMTEEKTSVGTNGYSETSCEEMKTDAGSRSEEERKENIGDSLEPENQGEDGEKLRLDEKTNEMVSVPKAETEKGASGKKAEDIEDAGLEEETEDGSESVADAGSGVAQGGGRDTGPWSEIKEKGYEKVWEELVGAEKGLSKFIWSWKGMCPSAFPREYLEEAYRNAVNMAAALEKLMIVRNEDGKVNNA